MARDRIPQHLQIWIEARKRHHLTDAQVQMARELGFDPKRLGKKDNHRQEPWKLPFPEYIQELSFKRFGKERPDRVESIEETARRLAEKKAARSQVRQLRRAAAREDETPSAPAAQPATKPTPGSGAAGPSGDSASSSPPPAGGPSGIPAPPAREESMGTADTPVDLSDAFLRGPQPTGYGLTGR